MEKQGDSIIDYNFLEKVIKEYKALEANGKIFVNIGNERKVIRAVSNTHINVTVTSEEEKEALHKKYLFEKTKNEKSKYPPKRISNLTQEMNKENVTTRDGIKLVQNNKVKKNIKKANTPKNKKYTLSKKMKEKITEFLEQSEDFLKRNGKKIGVGITALAVMGIIANEELSNRAENIQRFNNEFTSVEQVEEKIKGIIDAEIEEAVINAGLQTNKELSVDISRLEPYKEDSAGVEVEIRGLNVNFDNQMLLRERKGFNVGNMPESLEKMAYNYLDIAEIYNDGKEVKDSVKNKCIKALKKVESIAARKDLKIRKTIDSKIFGGSNYTMRETFERKNSNDELER